MPNKKVASPKKSMAQRRKQIESHVIKIIDTGLVEAKDGQLLQDFIGILADKSARTSWPACYSDTGCGCNCG
jgi:hypothetical protein